MFKIKINKNLAIIFALGISSGLPLALVMSTLKALLTDKGFDLQTIGFFSLIALPYSLKFLFAPFIDSLAIPYFSQRFGQRRSWILLLQIIIIGAIISVGIVGDLANLFLLMMCSLLLALASSCQDIAIDAYRIELIEKENQGLAASFYTYGYRLGMLISGALALFLSDHVNWQIVYFVMAIFMTIGVVTILLAHETRVNWRAQEFHFRSWFKNFVKAPILDFTTRKKWYIIFVFVICFKLGDIFAGSLTLPFLLDLDFSKSEIAIIVKTFGLFATLFGVLIGGILVKKAGIYKSLWIAGVVQMLSNLAFSCLAKIGHSDVALYYVIFVENFSGGIGDIVFVAYLTILCNISFSATQYALLTSLASLARSMFSSLSGIAAASFGWYGFFIFSTFLALPGLVFLYFLKDDKTQNDKT